MRIGRRGLSWLVLLAALAGLVYLFDWNWFKPQVERYFSEPTGRAVTADDLHLSLGEGLEPVVRLRGLRVENAPWAGPRPLIVAEEARFRFAWRSLIQRRPLVITELALKGAELNLVRRADGVRNWRLRYPDSTDDGHAVVQALRTENSRLRFEHGGLELVLIAESKPLAAASEPVKGETLTQDISFGGRYRGQAYEGRAAVGPEISFRHTGRATPLRGELRSRDTQLHAEGLVTDVMDLDRIEGDLRLRGPSLADIGTLSPTALPQSAAYTLNLQLDKASAELTRLKFNGELGQSDLHGELEHDRGGERPRLAATLGSKRAHLRDLLSLLRSGEASTVAKSERLLSAQPLQTAALRELDASIDLRVQTLLLPSLPPLDGLRLQAKLDHGVLDLKPVQAGWAEGRVSGTLRVDAQGERPEAKAELQWQKLRLESLFPDQPEDKRISGPLSGRASFSGRGESMASLVQGATGRVALSLQGGSLPRELEAKLGLNLGRMLKALVSGQERVPIHCGELVAALSEGRLRSQHLVFETAQTRLAGQGVLDLRDESFELWLDPQAKKGGLFSLPQSLRIRGRLAALADTATSLEAPRRFEGEEGCDPARPRG
jgi:uncharacterized protein involved in outer membrane biogenesis